MQPSFREYAVQVITNARAFADKISELGGCVISGGTDNHMFSLHVTKSYGIGGKEAEVILESVGISVNKNMVPFDERKPLDPSGIRIGTPAVTTRGMGVKEMYQLASVVHTALSKPLDFSLHAMLKEEVATLCKQFPIYMDQDLWTA